MKPLAENQERVEKAARKMGGLDFLVFDWIGYKMSDRRDDAYSTAALYLSVNSMLCDSIPKEFNIASVVTTQAKDKRLGSIRYVDHSHVPRCGDLNQAPAWVVGISCLTNNPSKGGDGQEPDKGESVSKSQTFYISKSRYGVAAYFNVERQFEYQRFKVK